MTELVHGFFRIFNTALAFGLGGYYFKQYLLAPLLEQRRKGYKELDNLDYEQEELHNNYQKLVKQHADDQILGNQLSNAIARWATVYSDQEYAAQKEHEQFRHEHTHRLEQLSERLYEKTVVKQTATEALRSARMQLQEQFKNKKNGEQFLEDVINVLHKGSHES